MEKNITQYKRKILFLLLRKYESSQSFQTGIPSKQRPQLTMAKSELTKDYEDELDYRKREWIHEALLELAQEGILEVTWPKLKENLQVHKIYLNFEGVDKAYKLLGETPKEDKLRHLIQILAPLASHPWDWIRAWQEETCTKLEERKSSGLDLEDPQGYEDLVKILTALPELEDSTPKRVFSQKLFQDSKYFEKRIEGRLVSLLRKIYPEELDKDEDYLDQIGIVDNPKLTLLCGPLVLQQSTGIGVNTKGDACGGSSEDLGEDSGQLLGEDLGANREKTLDLSLLPGGLGLSAESVKQLHIQELPAQTILLIENLTTYQEVLGVPDLLPPPMLVIYTGGFPNKSTQKLLGKISRFLADQQRNEGEIISIYHWGDIDYGGIRIFEYLRRNFFPNLIPYRMDATTYLEYQKVGLQFGEEQAQKLQDLLADPSYEEWYPVIEELLRHRKRVEQESIRIS